MLIDINKWRERERDEARPCRRGDILGAVERDEPTTGRRGGGGRGREGGGERGEEMRTDRRGWRKTERDGEERSGFDVALDVGRRYCLDCGGVSDEIGGGGDVLDTRRCMKMYDCLVGRMDR